MLKRTPTLTEQVKAHIKARIVADAYADGRIPAEADLATELGVSRATVRDALGRLELEGVVVRRQGAGTFVNPPGLQIKSRLEEMWSYEAVLEAHGYTPTVQVRQVEATSAESATATVLNLAPLDPVLLIEKLFLEATKPVILVRNWLPLHLLADDDGKVALPSAESCHVPIYQFLAEQCHCRLSYYVSDIVPQVADPISAEILHIPPQTPLITFDEVGYSDGNEPLLHSHSYFRDDLLRLRLIRRE